MQDALWNYYRELKAYQLEPTLQDRERLLARFDEIFGQRYPHHYGLNLAMEQFCAHKQELLRVLDLPQLPLHTNAAETDLREYVTRRKISGGTRNTLGRMVRDTFTGKEENLSKIRFILLAVFALSFHSRSHCSLSTRCD